MKTSNELLFLDFKRSKKNKVEFFVVVFIVIEITMKESLLLRLLNDLATL